MVSVTGARHGLGQAVSERLVHILKNLKKLRGICTNFPGKNSGFHLSMSSLSSCM